MRWATFGLGASWSSAAGIVVLAFAAGLAAGRFIGGTAPSAADFHEVAGLPVPAVAPDLHPQYRALLEEAKVAVCLVVDEFPTDVRAVASLAHLHNLAHDDEGEAVCWERCLELDKDFLLAYSSLAVRAANKGEYQRAEELLRRAMTVPGAGYQFAGLLASVLSDQGKFQQAARVLEDALAAQPPTVQGHIALGETYLRLEEFQKSRQQFEKALAIERNSTRALHGLAQALTRLGEKQEAEKRRAEMAKLKQREKETNRKKLEDAGDRRGDAILAPRFVAEVLAAVAAVYMAHNRKDDAERHLLRAAAIDAKEITCRTALVELFSSDGRLLEALAVVEELRRLEPNNPTHLKSLGILQGRLGRWRDAEKTFRELSAIAPDRSIGYGGLAETYLRAGKNLPLARLLAAKAAELEPSAWNFFVQGTICEQLGDMRSARLALRKAVSLEPGNPRYRQLYASLMEKD